MDPMTQDTQDTQVLDRVAEPALLRLTGTRAAYTVYGTVFSAHEVKAMVFTRMMVLRGEITDALPAGTRVAGEVVA